MQRVPVWRIAITVFVLLISLWLLLPTYEFYSIDPLLRTSGSSAEIIEIEKKIESGQGNAVELQNELMAKKRALREMKDNSLQLGLDLQGGVHLVIEVDIEEYEAELRAQGKSDSDIAYAKEIVLDSAAAAIESRVDAFGVAEAAIIKQAPNRIVLEMPGFSDPDAVKKLVSADSKLSFHIVAEQPDLVRIISDIDAAAPEDFQSLLAAQMPMRSVAAVAVQTPENFELVNTILQRSTVNAMIDRDLMFVWGNEEEPYPPYFDFAHRYLYLVKKKVEVSGSELDDAFPTMDPTTNQPRVSLNFNSDGGKMFHRTTRDNKGKYLAVVLNDRVFTAPVIRSEIRGGSAVIEGIGDIMEARHIAVVLRAGALPAPMHVEQSRVVGPSLGQDSIEKGIYAGMIGGSIVLVFMAAYYLFVGMVANLAVVMNLILLMAGMAFFNATLTLPGIAGLVLLIGMAVDANVLIFERMREEMKSKRAKNLPLVLDKAYGRAFMTIFDANLTTLITALVLFQFGTGPIKGFAVTLSLGIIISMFTAVFVTRLVFDIIAGRGAETLSIGNIRFFENANYNLLKQGKVFMMTSLAIGLAGFIFLAANWQNYQGIDFAGGSEVILAFDDVITADEVRGGMAQIGVADAVIQEVLGGEGKQMLIRVRGGENAVVQSSDELDAKIREVFPGRGFETLQADTVGAKVGGELLLKGLYCILFASVGILLYITARFEFRFAVAAVAALFHDILFTLSMLALTGTEFNLPIIAALLTVLGYSLNDTIVVFDRIRENYTSGLQSFSDVVNHSINQTLSRTVLTSVTTLLVIGTLHIVGGPVIHDFAFTLLIGVVVGTYSSIFVASPILLMMGKHEPKKVKDDGEAIDPNRLGSAA
ncbi:MAG: protein translocase subunit SecD [Candidatus Hinthialibacter antarcticus]|nr:protein translocase subunit SecD [Candidatus Hinthialibacter antarcticus]